jgi:2'-5' RNA ligase
MSAQFHLPGNQGGHGPVRRQSFLDERGRARFHRFFFALYPDADTAERICRLAHGYRRRQGLSGWPMTAERLHLTLNPVHAGRELDDREVAWVIEAAARVTRPSFLVGLDHIVSWRGGPRPLVLVGQDGTIGVEMLQAAIHLALRQAGLARRPRRELRPHVTLLRDEAETPTEFVGPVRWRVREFSLVHSPHGESRHEVLGRWALETSTAPRQ